MRRGHFNTTWRSLDILISSRLGRRWISTREKHLDYLLIPVDTDLESDQSKA